MLRILPPMFEPVLQEIRLQGLNRGKNKKNSVRGLYDKIQHVIELFTSDVMKKGYLKGWFTRHHICRQDLLVEK